MPFPIQEGDFRPQKTRKAVDWITSGAQSLGMSELVSLHRFGIGTLCRLLGERLFGHHGVICLIFLSFFWGVLRRVFFFFFGVYVFQRCQLHVYVFFVYLFVIFSRFYQGIVDIIS